MIGRALTPEAKRAVVERILRAWLAKPALRLGQLLYHAMVKHDPRCEVRVAEDEVLTSAVELFACPPPHDLTRSEVARARILAAIAAWEPSDAPGDSVVRDVCRALWGARMVTNAGALTAASRDLVDRARKVGVL